MLQNGEFAVSEELSTVMLWLSETTARTVARIIVSDLLNPVTVCDASPELFVSTW